MKKLSVIINFIGIILIFQLLGCGKVAEDIVTPNPSEFKDLSFNLNLVDVKNSSWSNLVNSDKPEMVYAYFEGVVFDTGIEKLGWASASLELDIERTEYIDDEDETENDIKPAGVIEDVTLTVKNYDSRKNLITSARYQQGIFDIEQISTDNFNIEVEFKRINPNKNDLYILTQYTNKQDAFMVVIDEIPTYSVTMTPYSHLISILYVAHLEAESYQKESLIDYDLFEALIPTAVITADIDIFPNNMTSKFVPMRPIFNYSDQTLDVLLQIITLVNYSDELDTLDYINTQNEKVLPNSIKALLIDSVTTHFSQIEPVDEVVSGDESSEIMADDDFLDGERLIDLGRRGESDDKYPDDAPPVIDPTPLNEDELPQL